MKELAAAAPKSRSCSAWTGAGMCALWNPTRFAGIVDCNTWERELRAEDDLLRHVRRGDLVPINLGFDSTFGFTVRTGPPGQVTLTGRETRYLAVSSEPYLYVADGELCLSGLEHVGAEPESHATTRIALAPGRYQVTAHLLDWEAEPDAKDEAGKPTVQALPDFVVLVSPEPTPSPSYRVRLETFDRPE